MKRFFCKRRFTGGTALLFLFVYALPAAFLLAGCGDPSNSGSGEEPSAPEPAPVMENWDEIASYLAGKPENTADTPYRLKLTGFDFSEHGMFPGVCEQFGNKYVDLDLSECTGTAFDSGGGGKGNIVSLILPESLAILPEGAFEGYGVLTSVTVSGAIAIGDRAFRNCGNLETLSLPPRITAAVSGAFAGCPNLTFAVREGRGNLTAPEGKRLALNGNTLLAVAEAGISGGACEVPEGFRELGTASFAGLPITSVTIPASVDKIGAGAFAGCTALGRADIYAVSPPEITLSGTGRSFPGNVTIRVPSASVSAYRTAWAEQFSPESFTGLTE
ncbi:MAG: leucine-rich repeat domain-containing protein [Spirochaetaceae bacterium]|jgi:hypothetical protein|nr:leucine-rich repeat domain-containing protein [Spirochaetaceae bacterium]